MSHSLSDLKSSFLLPFEFTRFDLFESLPQPDIAQLWLLAESEEHFIRNYYFAKNSDSECLISIWKCLHLPLNSQSLDLFLRLSSHMSNFLYNISEYCCKSSQIIVLISESGK